MAKDDYHVIAFRVLAYLYECAKTGEKPNLRQLRKSEPILEELTDSYWQYIIRHIFLDGYVEGVKIGNVVGSFEQVDARDIAITPKGIEYLESDSMMKKAFKHLKGVGAVVPGMIEIASHFI